MAAGGNRKNESEVGKKGEGEKEESASNTQYISMYRQNLFSGLSMFFVVML
mgnify:CR=1 FL=1